MLLINVVMIKISERDMINAKVKSGKLIIRSIGQHMKPLISGNRVDRHHPFIETDFRRFISELMGSGGFFNTSIIDDRGVLILRVDLSSEILDLPLYFARETMESGVESVHFSGRTWGVIWPNHHYLSISAPFLIQGRSAGAITLKTALTPIYDSLRNSEKVIILYIFLDTIILVMVGLYLISRTVINPINKLLQMTEEYKEGDIIPPIGETSRNEIGKLTQSLSVMLRRLQENKRELKEHISSLEQANEELQRAQEEIIRTEKLASVGRLAAGIAHEIGNPIGIILGYLDLIKKDDMEDTEKKDFLERMESEITRIHQIIRSLLDFSRPSSGKPERTGVHSLIKSTIEMLEPQPMMEDVRIKFRLNANKDTIYADPQQMMQVFLNIIMNALDSLSTEKDRDQIKEIALKSRNIHDNIEIAIEDNGGGIPEKEIEHIFDPFYTTKEPGKGTGLGLSVCYRIIERAGGGIQAESTPEKGTKIMIKLPIMGGERRGSRVT
jgi:signal transduction histidine kinase